MYEYRKLTPEQKAELIKERWNKGYPIHSPPHLVKDKYFYLLTAACYEHKHHMHSESRRQQLLNMIFDKCGSSKNQPSNTQTVTTDFIADVNDQNSAQALTTNLTICAWVVLPNHYHLLVHVVNFDILSELFRKIHGVTARQWNLEENVTKRKIWYRWSDRAIRSERHYYTTINYIHYNPVKHGFAKSPYDWVESSVHWYLQTQGRQWLRDCWIQYPVKDYGSTWDNF